MSEARLHAGLYTPACLHIRPHTGAFAFAPYMRGPEAHACLDWLVFTFLFRSSRVQLLAESRPSHVFPLLASFSSFILLTVLTRYKQATMHAAVNTCTLRQARIKWQQGTCAV